MSIELGIVPFWKQYDRKTILRAAQTAEGLGYHSIWIPEAWAYEQFQLLTEIALGTKTLELATGIANVFSRSPGLLAMSAATLDEISGGRARLGLGTSGKKVIENFHGVPYRKPLTRMRETVNIMRTLWRGGRLSEETATLFELRHFKLEMSPLRPEIPIHVASLNEKAIRQTGEIGDGWMPTFWPYEHFKDGIALLAEGAEKAGRDVKDVKVTPFVSVVPLDDVDAARMMIKPLVSFYIGGMGTYYHSMFCRYGFQETADEVRDLYNGGQRQEAIAAVSDELIDAIAICGPTGHCRDKLVEWEENGLDTAILGLPPGVPYEMLEHFLNELAPR